MKRNALLWTAQVTLCALFVFAGTMKLVMPIEAMAGPVALPGWFLRFIGVAEVLGGLGLVLPWMLGIAKPLTSIAAAGLLAIMIGAVSISAVGGLAAAAVPAIVGVLCATIARARHVQVRDVAPASSRSVAAQAA